MSDRGILFHIQRFSVHDGPGIRTTVFFKGCPMRCEWCHNPEGLRRDPQISLRSQRCLACGECIPVCPAGAITRSRGAIKTDVSLCTACGSCVRVCTAQARELAGREFSVDEVMLELERDRPFYDRSGGGVTFSGGEPTHQPGFLAALAAQCKKDDLHTVLDTCGHVAWRTLEPILSDIDLVLYDLKHLDPEKHLRTTGVSNELILENLNRLVRGGHRVVIRTPVIPGHNDDVEHGRRLGEFLASLPSIVRLELLPFHAIAGDKVRRLGISGRLPDSRPLDAETLHDLVELLRDYKIDVRIEGE